MSLPTIKQPIYKLGDITYRGFTHAEEKIFLQMKESENKNDIVANIVAVLDNCTFGNCDVGKRPITIVELLFIAVRSKSGGEIVPIKYICNHKVAGKACNEQIILKIDLDEVIEEFQNKDNIELPDIKLDEDLNIRLKIPEFNELLNAGEDQDKQLIALIDQVYDAEQVYDFTDSTEEDIGNFLDSIPFKPKQKIKEFLEKIPRISHEETFDCKCGKTHKVKLKGLEDFFQ